MATREGISSEPTDELTEDERELFRRIQENSDDERIHRLCEIVLQSSDDNEEANS